MAKFVLLLVLIVFVSQAYGDGQVQMPEASELTDDGHDLQSQIRDLQKNVTDIWSYIYELRNAVSGHLVHLRIHQEELESSMHRMEHLHDGSGTHHQTGEHHFHGSEHAHGSDHHDSSDDHAHQSHSDDHSHGSEHHSHSDHTDQSHSDDHSHGSEHHSHAHDHTDQSHSDDHSHGSEHDSHSHDHTHLPSSEHSHATDYHSHSDDHAHSHGDDHSHGGHHSSEHHGHSGEHHSHGNDYGHHSHSESHSHTSHDHSKEDHSHGADHQDHKDSHETEDLSQQTQKVDSGPGPISEPVVVATNANAHHNMEERRLKPTINRMNLMSGHDFHHHHHQHDRKKNKTVEVPHFSEYNLYDFATCKVQPNRAIPEDQQQNVEGNIVFWQKKNGGPLNIHMKLQGFAVGDHHGHHGDHQAIQQEVESVTSQEKVENSGGHRHGFHIHINGDLSNGCQNTGPHYNPKNVNHGGPHAMVRHVGDLGNIECDEHGVTNILFSDDVASLKGQYSIVGRSAVIHANQDDLGLGGDVESLKTGNAGTRIACCVIQKVEKIPIRYYKVMKTGKQYKN